MAVIRPSPHKMDFLSNYLSFRATYVKKKILPERQKSSVDTHGHKPSSRDTLVNISHMTDLFIKKDMTQKSGLWNIFEEKETNLERSHDLKNFRQIGQQLFDSYVETRLLNIPSTDAPKRKKSLTTFTVTATQKRKKSSLTMKGKLVKDF